MLPNSVAKNGVESQCDANLVALAAKVRKNCY